MTGPIDLADSLTPLEPGRPQTVVATVEVVQAVDDIRYQLDSRPCVSAVAGGRANTSGNLGGSTRWPRSGPRVGRLDDALTFRAVIDQALGILMSRRVVTEPVGRALARHVDALEPPLT